MPKADFNLPVSDAVNEADSVSLSVRQVYIRFGSSVWGFSMPCWLTPLHDLRRLLSRAASWQQKPRVGHPDQFSLLRAHSALESRLCHRSQTRCIMSARQLEDVDPI